MSFKIHESGNPKNVWRNRKKNRPNIFFGAIESLAGNKTSSKIGDFESLGCNFFILAARDEVN
jgi:hypothetical protein